jgi:hypothetical protein
MSMMRLLCLLLAGVLFTAACGSNAPSPDLVRIAVESTLHALPPSTRVPPTLIVPTPTPITLTGLYCEYQFCIGHPPDMAFYDVSAAQNQKAPSTISQGILASYNANLFLLVMWQAAPGSNDAQFMLDPILQYGADTRNGSVQPKLAGDLDVYYVPITPSAGAASTLPFGGAAAWMCGGRAFAWKAYTAQAELAASLLADSLAKFRCAAK